MNTTTLPARGGTAVNDIHSRLNATVVERVRWPAFAIEPASDDFRANDVGLIDGTVWLVEREGERALAWAREPWACVIFNLHIEHSARGIGNAAAFRRLVDHAIALGGSYDLTYHRWATGEQVQACHPHIVPFLAAKRRLDPGEAVPGRVVPARSTDVRR